MTNYKDTLHLPQTAFAMKANLPAREPVRLKSWEESKLYEKIREKHQGHPTYILHDGPPYANGHLHCGHALNKILKDMVVKSKTLSGFDAPFVPGWDCHGLPIELNVEKKLGKAGVKISHSDFRSACRAYAQSQIEIQREEFKRLGVFGDWQNPYITMDYTYEANVVRALGKMLKAGHVYQGFKPVHWCIDCGSALAEAELEYEDKTSSAIDVAFYAEDPKAFLDVFGMKGTKPVVVPIWTTTPWTLPANEAICLHPDIEYALYESDSQCWLFADPLAEAALARYKVKAHLVAKTTGKSLLHLTCRHPFLDKGVPIILGEHVTTDAGTGCVHTAPAHGVEDYEAGQAFKLPFENPVLSNGCYAPNVPFFAGLHVFKANQPVIEKLKETNTLLAEENLLHSYPHCWRHKTPMIFLATPQWFISMEITGLRKSLLAALESIEFMPEWGRVRMMNMISSRPDWCISRQRTWGTPIPVFIHRVTRSLHPKTTEFIEKIADLIEQKGVESWFELDVDAFLGKEATDYEQVTDILDVWFDAGLSHDCVLKERKELHFPADLYLEGSDQYRGWFNSALTTSMALDKTAPYKMVLTHGYTVDAHGKKLSKSQGNYVELDKLIAEYGADLIRLWVASTDYRHEVSISDEILKRLADAYRRIRNTARFLLANLFDFDPKQHLLLPAQLLEFDAVILMRAQWLQESILKDYAALQFHTIYQKVHHFCSVDLGSFYLDIIKDRQYTTGENSIPRRSCQTVMYYILQAFSRWIAPMLSFTSEEIWEHIPGEKAASVFLSEWYKDWPIITSVDLQSWETLQGVRDEVNKALEIAREAQIIGSGLAAEVVVYAKEPLFTLLAHLGKEVRFFFITSGAEIKPFEDAPQGEGVYHSTSLALAVKVQASLYEKCVRCWHRTPDIGKVAEHPELCGRCADTVNGVDEERRIV